MAYEESPMVVTYVAGADLRAHQYKFVEIDATGRVVLCGDDAHADGVLMNAPDVGEAATVGIGGILKVRCGAAVTRGGPVSSGANGAAKNAGSGAVNGTALETGASGRVISIQFHPRG